MPSSTADVGLRRRRAHQRIERVASQPAEDRAAAGDRVGVVATRGHQALAAGGGDGRVVAR
jgi:hypothetical protein